MKKVYVTANDNEHTITVDNIVDPSVFFTEYSDQVGVSFEFAEEPLEGKALILGRIEEGYSYEIIQHDGYAYLVVLKKETNERS
jgi:hypothetical protein